MTKSLQRFTASREDKTKACKLSWIDLSMKEQNGANGVCYNKMLFAVQHHNRKDRNEKPQSAGKGARSVEGGIRMGRVKKNYRTAVRHGASTKDIPSCRAATSSETTLDTKRETSIERKGVWMAEGRDDQKGSTPRMGRGRTSIIDGIPVQMFPMTPKRIQPNKNGRERQRENRVSYERRGILFHPHARRIKKLGGDTSKDDGKGLDRSKRAKRGSIPGRNSGEKQKRTELIKEGKYLGHMVAKEGVRADPEKVQTIIRIPTQKSPSQIRSLFLQLTTIGKFIPKLAELKYPINKVRMRMDVAACFGWTNEAEEAFQRIKRKLNKLQTLAIPKEGEKLMLCLRQENKTISSILMVEREGVQTLVSYVSRPLQGMEICCTPTKKIVQALIHTIRSLMTTFRKHKVVVITDGPMEEILKLFEREGRLAKWVAKIRIYDISYIQRKEAKGSVVKKFFGQGEQVQKTPETIEEGSGVGIILVSLDEKMHSYVIRLKFNASDHALDCEALLARLVVSVNKGMKGLHIFIDSLTLVAQIEGNYTPATEQERKYKEEIMDATAPFHWLRITHLPKILNSKAETLIGLATIKLEFVNQEVSVGIKTRPSIEEISDSKKEKVANNVSGTKPNYNWETSASN
ncbi:reverse transcriptase domain-containing protein [Tanacetum coccineum]